MGNKDSHQKMQETFEMLAKADSPELQKKIIIEYIHHAGKIEQVYDILNEHLIRKERDTNHSTFVAMLWTMVDIMYELATSEGPLSNSDVKTVLGLINVLSRILPFIFGNPDYADLIFWFNTIPSMTAEPPNPPKEEIATKEEEDADKFSTPPETAKSTNLPLPAFEPLSEQAYGAKLLESIAMLMFKGNLCISDIKREENSEYSIDRNSLWKGGVVHEKVYHDSDKRFDKHRIDILRLLHVCLTSTIYQPSFMYMRRINPFLTFFTNSYIKNSKNIFFSLFNTLLRYDWKGFGIPYLSSLQSLSGDHELLVDKCAQILCILLDYKVPTIDNAKQLIGTSRPINTIYNYFVANIPNRHSRRLPEETQINGPEESMKSLAVNEYLRLLMRVNGKTSFELMFTGFAHLFKNIYQAKNTTLPNSMREITFYQEVVIIFWRLIHINMNFVDHMLLNHNMKDILLPLFYLMDICKNDTSKVNLLYILTFVFFVLSEKLEFGMALMQPYTENLNLDIPIFKGTYADLLILMIFRIIAKGSLELRTMHSTLLSTLLNISAVVHSLAIPTCLNLLQLTKYFLQPHYLLSSNGFTHLKMALNIVLNLLQYNYQHNINMAYVLLRQSSLIDEISVMNFIERSDLKKKIEINYQEAAIERKKTAEPEDEPPKEENKVEEEVKVEGEEMDKELKEEEKTAAPVEAPISSSPETPPRGFQPTQEWFNEQKKILPIDTFNRIVMYLTSRMEQAFIVRDTTESEMLRILEKTAILVVLESVPRFMTMQFVPHEAIEIWLASYLYGLLYVKNQIYSLFDAPAIKLFGIARSRRNTQDSPAVNNNIPPQEKKDSDNKPEPAAAESQDPKPGEIMNV